MAGAVVSWSGLVPNVEATIGPRDGEAPPVNEPSLAAHWSLDPTITFLNHGSFGACPRAVQEVQTELRARLERDPVQFFIRELASRLGAANAALATFVGCDAEDLVFVPNVTTGVNTVVRSLRFAPGDELLTTDHAYPACRNALAWVAERSGARLVTARVPFPLTSAAESESAILAAATPRTKLALLDHVSSPTGLVFPIARLVSALAERGIDTLVDGAHAPGMLPLDLRALGAAYYTGNCHKWLCAPKGAGFLYVRRDRQDGVVPASISHGLTSPCPDPSRFQVLFGWTGTGDPTAALCVPDALRVVGGLLPGGWPEVMARNHALALVGRDRLCAALGVPPPAPDDMLGSLAAVPLPDGSYPGDPVGPMALDPLSEALWANERIEVPVFRWPAPSRKLIRISAQLYNTAAQFDRLTQALSRQGVA
jgi:isopenicillin-N epimerase